MQRPEATLRAAGPAGCLCPPSGDRSQAAMEMRALAADNAATKQHLFPSKLNRSAGRPSLTHPPLTGRLTHSQALLPPRSPPFARPAASLSRRLRPGAPLAHPRRRLRHVRPGARPRAHTPSTREHASTPARTCWVKAVFHAALDTYHVCGSEGLFPSVSGLLALVIDENVHGFPIISDAHVSDVCTTAQARRVPHSVRVISVPWAAFPRSGLETRV